jgi:hypothetical protein
MQQLYSHNCVSPRRTLGFIVTSWMSRAAGPDQRLVADGRAFIARRFVLKLDPNVFRLVMDGIMIVAGVATVWNAFCSAS